MTSKMKGIVISIALIVIALILTPIAVDAAFDVQTDSQGDSFPGTAVSGGNATVNLTEELYLGDVTFVSSVTANGTGAVPVAAGYSSPVLTVTGLGADNPQDITATYSYDANADFSGVTTVTGLVPILVVVGIILVAIVNGIWTLKGQD